ncbi:GNAT family N-acetyltransferase [Alkalihalobacillus sp. LMS6]|uniref:GNAT family N-acetyltransferase n=1 Tax=Bacillaceae TaxID=186817 RepID=UPI000C06EB9A|nr:MULTISPECIES: GNAT family protein [Bacillaceae]UTR06881.1 GNAT family N-acetyltransferase [Alkalihalobacillus sp. LMS6]
MYTDNELEIRPINESDLATLWELIYKDEQPEWKQWDAPYFPHQSMSYESFLAKKDSWVNQSDRWVITVDQDICGTVSYYYEDVQQHWLEMGIIFYQAQRWGKGLGTRALRLWIDHLFQTTDHVRVGLTTWSGNTRMIHAAERLGMKLEARIRNVRYYNGHYYDSIRMGLLREEWAANE